MAENKEIKKEATVYHVTPKGDHWQVKGAGNLKATKLFNTQKEAIEYANEIAKKREGSLLIHRTNGQVRDSKSFKPKKSSKK
ncbi:DUF2188 domain-containing protein [Mycoplasmopsis gallinarum]|uniref:DUF2188 domain-containing protein n=1 Tax=Mycoplasmopsis gallinarum TaxID=29557 RepID=A0A168R7X0_9BACT|nr:DUF2188 domain-containing protein [Mycoplasmopsis gallinarum]OAB48693.1 hypothetical protein MGALLINA_05800 [Mycoplasmopsis gallinarum]